MASRSSLSYSARAELHSHLVAKKLFGIAEAKQSNLIISADFTDAKNQLECADALGLYIAVFKTHLDILHDFNEATAEGLKALAIKHNFLIFEDRKFINIGNAAQKQDIVNVSILAGEGVVEAMSQIITSKSFAFSKDRALLLLAEMTTAGSLATGSYTEKCIEIARQYPATVIGFVATRALTASDASSEAQDEDFLIFATGVNQIAKGDSLGQQYQTPSAAVKGRSDFIIAGRGIYASTDPIASAKMYQREGWQAYQERIQHGNSVLKQ
ncbi:orotidine 5'-phosphate decarboxylase [Neonectria magnoliae]|uniref:Orotidine 5'-phosphate decarboxylase n=1 Tax=Neonectria magnoliae TaxID=2732573 RepID=A0ABR1IE00_9HYPO